MRVVLDTNVLISALLIEASLPGQLIALWHADKFGVLISAEQLEEIRRVTRYPKIHERLAPALAGRLINELRDLGEWVANLPPVTASPDPYDDYLLATAAAGHADFLVTGDKSDLLTLRTYEGIRIVTVRAFLDLHR